MAAVASMYEDRFDLSILECQLIESRSDENENFGWLKKIGFMRSGSISSSPRYVSISSISIPVKRTKELRALVGWYVILWLPFIFLVICGCELINLCCYVKCVGLGDEPN